MTPNENPQKISKYNIIYSKTTKMNARYHNTTETAPQQHQAYKVLTTQVIKTPTIQVKNPPELKEDTTVSSTK